MATISSTAENVIEIVLTGHGVRGPPLRPTATHPIFSETAKKWVRAGELNVGDRVRADGGASEIAEIRRFPGAHLVFNLEVEGDHEYFAGEQRVLSHNSNVLPCPVQRRATVGSGASSNYRTTFYSVYAHLRGKCRVHHAVEQQVLKRYPGLFRPDEIHSFENLRGIPNGLNNEMHLSYIRKQWNRFYDHHDNRGIPPTRDQVLEHASFVDNLAGHLYAPSIR